VVLSSTMADEEKQQQQEEDVTLEFLANLWEMDRWVELVGKEVLRLVEELRLSRRCNPGKPPDPQQSPTSGESPLVD
jgi:hypothetical protein